MRIHYQEVVIDEIIKKYVDGLILKPIGDGISDDTKALQNTIDNKKEVIFDYEYFIDQVKGKFVLKLYVAD